MRIKEIKDAKSIASFYAHVVAEAGDVLVCACLLVRSMTQWSLAGGLSPICG